MAFALGLVAVLCAVAAPAQAAVVGDLVPVRLDARAARSWLAPPLPAVPGPAGPPAPAAPVDAAPPAEPAITECAEAPLPVAGAAEAFTAMWNRSGPGWTAADGTFSAVLPDGRVAWLFGDTVFGDGTMVRNTLVVQDGACLTTRFGGSRAEPAAFVAPADAPAAWFWPNQPFVERGALQVPLTRVSRTGPGVWDFAVEGTVLASFSLPGLELTAIRPIATGSYLWGASIVDEGAHSYVFGVEDRGGADKHLHVARAPRGQVATATWEAWDGSDWVPGLTGSARVLSGVSNQLSVVRDAGGWVAITQRDLFSGEIAAHRAPSAHGPYEPDGVAIHDFGIASYNAVAHPELGSEGGLLVSTNVNRPGDYRPRFARVTLPPADAG